MEHRNIGNSSVALHITDAEFQKQVIGSDLPVVVDFWAPWCPPCKRLSPLLDKLAADYAGKLVIAKVNIDDSPAYADQFAISSIPSLLFFLNGKVVDKTIGVASERELRHMFDALLARGK
jgi:thioredoxin